MCVCDFPHLLNKLYPKKFRDCSYLSEIWTSLLTYRTLRKWDRKEGSQHKANSRPGCCRQQKLESIKKPGKPAQSPPRRSEEDYFLLFYTKTLSTISWSLIPKKLPFRYVWAAFWRLRTLHPPKESLGQRVKGIHSRMLLGQVYKSRNPLCLIYMKRYWQNLLLHVKVIKMPIWKDSFLTAIRSNLCQW